MKIDKPIECAGFFWLPSDNEDRLPGILKISESCNISVELQGIFGSPQSALSEMGVSFSPPLEEDAPCASRILGQLQSGNKVTLDECSYGRRRLRFPGGPSQSVIHAKNAYLGAHYDGNEEILFSEISLSIDGLEEWLSISGIKSHLDIHNKRGMIEYHLPESIPIAPSANLDLEFSFKLSGPPMTITGTSRFLSEVRVRQTALAYLKPNDVEPVEYFAWLVLKLCNFLAFALGEDVSVRAFTGYSHKNNSYPDSNGIVVEIYGRFAPWTEQSPNFDRDKALFLYPNVSHRLEGMISKWLENYETIGPAFDLYFATRTQTSLFVDTKILLLAQALETLHRRTSQEKEMAEDEFATIRDTILQSCPQDKRQWLAIRLSHANELGFRRRIQRLIEPFKDFLGDGKTAKDLINKICDTRNYLTHYDETSTRYRAVTPSDLLELLKKMEAIFQLRLLMLLGFDYSSIEVIVENSEPLRSKLSEEPNWTVV